MILKSFSKINLSLTVNRKLKKNRLHDIQSYFCLIDLCDLIKIRKIKGRKDIVKFQGKFAKFIKNKSNSIIKVLKILREKDLISEYYSVLVNKRIPVFAGMGGGTSNAVCLIKYFTGNKINKNLSSILDKKIGSDLRLFFHKQGFLKNLKTINNFRRKFRLYFLLVYPNIKCSTAYVYSKVKKYSIKSQYSFSKIKDKSKYMEFLANKDNDLQSIVEKKYPNIKKLIIEIGQKKGCYFSRMTGSGSVCYGVFKSQKTAKAALNRVKLKYPKYWLSVAKTI
tara:strand:- start:321 stop:1160 length:840 start_codon:yes stop_codon:yes gene_type:complete